jgi:serine/threonine-protein kinase
MTEPVPQSVPIQEIGKYRIIRSLGKGGFGEVFLAQDRALNCDKAIKVLDAEDTDEAMAKLREAQILYQCRHKHIVHVNEANVYRVNGERKVVIDMEYLEHGSVESLLRKQFVPVTQGIRYVIGSLYGLEYAHSKNILHRDVKPANVMLADRHTKLSDFGLATVSTDVSYGSPQRYRTHTAPEHYLPNGRSSVATDIFAAGATAFRIINNTDNWNEWARSLDNLHEHLRAGDLIEYYGFQPFVPPQLRRIIRRACRPAPAGRYRTVLEFRQALEQLKPAIQWARHSETEWYGVQLATGQALSAFVYHERNEYHFVLFIGSRTSRKHSQKFERKEVAVDWLCRHVAASTLS